MRKLLINILFILLVVACKQSSVSDKTILTKSERIKKNNPPLNKNLLPIEGIIFGRICNGCDSICASMFNLNTLGNIWTLKADLNNTYFQSGKQFKFATDISTSQNLEIAYKIMENIPITLREWDGDKKVFGYGDCSIFVEFVNGTIKRFTKS